MQTLSLHVDDIEIGDRQRPISGDAVDRLAASMRDIGLRQPITVRIVDEREVDGVLVSGVPVLVTGAHRLAAARALGWSHIDCIEIDDDAIKAEMWEISENLHRHDLTKAERDRHIRRYAELLEASLQSPHNAAIESRRSDGRGHRHRGVARQIADATGLSDDTVRRALRPVSPPAIPREPLSDYDVSMGQYNSLMAAWNRAGQEAREMFLAEIDGPIFDKTGSSA